MKRVMLVLVLILVLVSSSVAASTNFFPYYNEEVFTAPSVFNQIVQKEIVKPISVKKEILVGKEETKIETIEPQRISILEKCFAPEKVSVKVNQPVIWKNERKHVKSLIVGVREISGVRSNFLNPDDAFIHQFSEPGEYTYVDSVVIGVVGKIVVE